MRGLFPIVIIAMVGLLPCTTLRAQSSASGDLVAIIRQVEQVSNCLDMEKPPARGSDLSRLCNFIPLFQSRSINSLPREGLRVDSAEILTTALRNLFAANAAPGVVKTKAAALLEDLQQGRIPTLPELRLVPAEICSKLGLSADLCSVPDCLLNDGSAPPAARCMVTPAKVAPDQLRKVIHEWRQAHNQTSQCDAADVCLPTVAQASVLREYLGIHGLAALGPPLERAIKTGDFSATTAAVQENLLCWVNRNEAILIASAAQSAFADSESRAKILDSVLTTSLGIQGGPARGFGKPCNPSDIELLYSATAQVLRSALEGAVKEQLQAASTTPHASVRCGTEQLSKEELFDFPVSKGDRIKVLRLRRIGGGGPGNMQVILVVPNPLAGKAIADQACPAVDFEVVLGVSASVAWAGNVPRLAGNFGAPAFKVDYEQLPKALNDLLPLKSLDLTVDAKLSANIVPVTVTATAQIPGLALSFPLPPIQIDPAKPDHGLGSVLHPEAFRGALNDAIAKVLVQPVKVPSIGIEVRSLKWVSTAGDSAAPRFAAVAHVPALAAFAPNIPVELYLSPTSNGKSMRLMLRTAQLPTAVTQRLKEEVTAEINRLLSEIPNSMQLGKLDSLQMRLATVGADGIHIESALTLPDTPLDPIPIALNIKLTDSDPIGQIRGQVKSLEKSLRAALTDYVRLRLEQAVGRLARDAFDELRSKLPPSYPLFGTSWSLANVRLDNDDVRALCFDLVSKEKWTVERVCTRELDANKVPRLLWTRAKINQEFKSHVGEQVARLSQEPYFVVRLSDVGLKESQLVAELSVSVLDVAMAVPVSAKLGTTAGSLRLDKDAIASIVIGEARPRLAKALEGKEVSVAQFQLTDLSVPDAGAKLAVHGKFRNADWLSGSITLTLYPKFEIDKPQVNLGPALKKLIEFPTDSALKVEDVTVDPIVIKVSIKLASVPFLDGITGVTLPTVHVDVPLRGKPRIVEPIAIPIPIEIPIPPWFTLANPVIALYPQTMPMTFTGTADFTVVQGAMANLVKVRSSVKADLKNGRFEFQGPLTLLNFMELTRTDGTLDAKEVEAILQSGTSGLIDKVVSTNLTSRLNGQKCRLTQNVKADLLKSVSVTGELILQVKCGEDYDACPLRGAGSACVKGKVELGPLGDAEGQLGASLDFKAPVVSARVTALKLLNDRPSINVRVASKLAEAGFHFGPFDVRVLAPGIDQIRPELLENLLRQLLKPHFDLDALKNRKIVLSLLPPANGKEDPESDIRKAQRQAEKAEQQGNGSPTMTSGATPPPQAPPSAKAAPAGTTLPPAIRGAAGTSGNLERALIPGGTTEVRFTDRDRQQTGPLVWRHWVSTNPPSQRDSNWFMSEALSAALRSDDVKAFPVISSPRVKGLADALPSSAPVPVEYQVLVFEKNTDTTVARCGTGVCTAQVKIDDGRILDLATEAVLRKLFDVPDGPLGPALTANDGQRTRNNARHAALRDLVLAAWEGSPTVDDLSCLWPDRNECVALLLKGRRDGVAGVPVGSWVYVAGYFGAVSWLVHPGSLLEAGISQPEFPLPIRTAMSREWSRELSVLARSDNEFLIRYRDDDGSWLAVWDKRTLKEIVRIAASGSWPVGARLSDAAVELTAVSFGKALIDQLKGVSDPLNARIRAGVTRVARSFSLRERGPSGDKLTYLTVNVSDRRNTNELPATSFCIRSDSAASLAAKVAEGQQKGEAPATAPATADLVVDYLDGILGKGIDTWRKAGFLVNPLLMLNPLLTRECIQP